MINTFSRFFYGFDVTPENFMIDFSEGGPELTAEVAIGSYTPSDFCIAVKTALDAVGDRTYAVTFNRVTRRISIAANGSFSLLNVSGSHFASALWSMMGITQNSDLTGSLEYTGLGPAGDFYSPQFWLQDYVPKESLQQAVEATVNKTASGRVEVVKFGIERFIECEIMWATNIQQDGRTIRNNPNGKDDLIRFLQYLITKAPVEFMPDESDPGTFDTIMLESTSESNTGVGYRLREMYDLGLPDYYRTGRLKFRVLEN